MDVDNSTVDIDVTAEDLLRQIESLPSEERLKIAYELSTDAEWERIKQWGVSIVGWLDSNRLVNKCGENRSDLTPLVAMMHTSALLMKEAFGSQARLEMQHQSEITQWGMQLSDAISDLASNVEADAENMATLLAHYEGVLQGRRIGVEYQDEFGAAIVYQQEEEK